MKNLSLIPIIFLFLSACSPRDVRVVPEEMRGGNNFNGSNKDFFLKDEVLGAHLVERQMEALVAIELAQTESGKKFQYKKRVSEDQEIDFSRSNFSENLKTYTLLTDDQWSISNSGMKLSGKAERSLLEAANRENLREATLKLTERRELTVTGDLNGEFTVVYAVKADGYRKGKFFDHHPIDLDINMTVRKEGSHYRVVSSVSTANVYQTGKADFKRELLVSSNDGFVLKLGTCPYAEGTLALFRFKNKEKQTGTLEFSQNEIRGTDGKWKDDLIDCSRQSRPLIDLSRLLR